MTKCDNCGSTKPAERSARGLPLAEVTWHKNAKGRIVCSPYCAGFLDQKSGLRWDAPSTWKQYTPPEPS